MSSQSSTVTAAQGGGASTGVKPEAGVRRKGLLLLGLSLGYFMVLLDTSVVNVALPAIRDDIGGGLSGLQWVVNGYTLTFAALLLTMGALSDRFGARKVFLTGTWAFLIASGLTAASPNLGVLIGMRGVLGIAGAALLPASMAVIATAYTDPAQRARALGSWAAITGVALAAGPVVGGVLTDTLGLALHLRHQRAGRPAQRADHPRLRAAARRATRAVPSTCRASCWPYSPSRA